MKGFILTGKIGDILQVLAALAELEREFPHTMALLDGSVVRLSNTCYEWHR